MMKECECRSPNSKCMYVDLTCYLREVGRSMNGHAALEDLVQDTLVRSLFLTPRRLSVTVYVRYYVYMYIWVETGNHTLPAT